MRNNTFFGICSRCKHEVKYIEIGLLSDIKSHENNMYFDDIILYCKKCLKPRMDELYSLQKIIKNNSLNYEINLLNKSIERTN
jgi:hypothetical protein